VRLMLAIARSPATTAHAVTCPRIPTCGGQAQHRRLRLLCVSQEVGHGLQGGSSAYNEPGVKIWLAVEANKCCQSV